MGVMDLLRLDGLVALVTGGSRGLGLQIAAGLAEAGAAVAIMARKEAGLAEAEADLKGRGFRALAVRCDVSNHAEVQPAVDRVAAELGGVHILVNNAGATWGAPWDQVPLDAWDKVIRTNVNGTWYMSQAAARVMVAQGRGGRIINIASVAGLRGTDPRFQQTLPYNTSKGAIVNFTRDLAAKLAEHRINVNCICPGFFPTRMTRVTLDQLGEAVKEFIPLRRFGGEEDLKGIAVLLASPASAYITGQIIAVDGGLTAI